MITHLLDTSVYSERLRRDPLTSVVERWTELGNAALAISVLCEAELRYTLERRASSRLWAEYEQYLRNQLVVLPLAPEVIEVYARTKAELAGGGPEIGEFNLLIGATALAHNLHVATLDPGKFARIPGLLVEDWG